jgi:hypothetical protein
LHNGQVPLFHALSENGLHERELHLKAVADSQPAAVGMSMMYGVP